MSYKKLSFLNQASFLLRIVVSERLGHSNIGITLDTYSHVLPGLQEAAANQFSEVISRSLKSQKNVL